MPGLCTQDVNLSKFLWTQGSPSQIVKHVNKWLPINVADIIPEYAMS